MPDQKRKPWRKFPRRSIASCASWRTISNSVETILQASYLLAQMKLEEDAKKWSGLVENAARDCARINREIREILRASA